MSKKEVLLTYEGLKKLEEELEILKGEKRKEIADRIKQALAFEIGRASCRERV